MERNRTLALLSVVCLLATALLAANAWAIDLGDLLKVGGIAWLVDRYDGELDTFITSALGERQAAAKGATKVVPILSLGSGGYIGAAQVVGNPDNVKQVKAVIQLEGRIGSFRPRVLVPTTTDRASGTPDRAKGVGVSAVIEFSI